MTTREFEAYDGIYLEIVDLMKRVEWSVGTESPLFDMLDESRLCAIENAPPGWSLEDVLEREDS